MTHHISELGDDEVDDREGDYVTQDLADAAVEDQVGGPGHVAEGDGSLQADQPPGPAGREIETDSRLRGDAAEPLQDPCHQRALQNLDSVRRSVSVAGKVPSLRMVSNVFDSRYGHFNPLWATMQDIAAYFAGTFEPLKSFYEKVAIETEKSKPRIGQKQSPEKGQFF